MGQLDIDPRRGFANPVHLTYPTSEAACVSTSTADLCGAFALNTNNVNEDVPCEIILDPLYGGSAWRNVQCQPVLLTSPAVL